MKRKNMTILLTAAMLGIGALGTLIIGCAKQENAMVEKAEIEITAQPTTEKSQAIKPEKSEIKATDEIISEPIIEPSAEPSEMPETKTKTEETAQTETVEPKVETMPKAKIVEELPAEPVKFQQSAEIKYEPQSIPTEKTNVQPIAEIQPKTEIDVPTPKVEQPQSIQTQQPIPEPQTVKIEEPVIQTQPEPVETPKTIVVKLPVHTQQYEPTQQNEPQTMQQEPVQQQTVPTQQQTAPIQQQTASQEPPVQPEQPTQTEPSPQEPLQDTHSAATCNTCGATMNDADISSHGAAHMLNNENFSYNVN